ALNCVAYNIANATGAGFSFSSSGGNQLAVNCIAEAVVGNAYTGGGNNSFDRLINCAGYNNGANYTVADRLQVESFHALSGSPFVAAGSLNFALNSTASAGAALRAAGFPSSWPGLSTSNYLDIGAAQHQDTPATAGAVIFM